LGRFGLVRGGGRQVPGNGTERPDDQVDQTDQQRRQPVPAAVRGQVFGELGERLLGGLWGWGCGVHIVMLEFMTFGVKRGFADRCNLKLGGRTEVLLSSRDGH
jgi:hypothetical protein